MVDIVANFRDTVPQIPTKVIRASEVTPVSEGGKRIAIIRTSDRIAFKQCRRRWGWSSHLRHNLGPPGGVSALWYGTGFHFALEDFHGWNRFGHPVAAFEAYYKVFKDYRPNKLPDDHVELLDLGRRMLDYYIIWLQQRIHSQKKTYWLNGEPQVEVNFRFKIPFDQEKLESFGYDEAYYSGTIDRVCIDDYGMLWPRDYKTAKNIEKMHFLTDPQVSAYMWAMPHIYEAPVGGFEYQQFCKSLPNPGRILQNGMVSTAQNQGTNYYMYRQTLIEVYGSVDRAPDGNQQFLKSLSVFVDEDKDGYIDIDRISRNDRHGQSEGAKILMELEDMLNPDLPLYPNPTRMCAHWQYPCPFLSPCVSMDDGGDWRAELELTTEPRESRYDGWRDLLVWPGEVDPKAKKNEEFKLDTSFLDV